MDIAIGEMKSKQANIERLLWVNIIYDESGAYEMSYRVEIGNKYLNAGYNGAVRKYIEGYLKPAYNASKEASEKASEQVINEYRNKYRESIKK
jgi:hypothetical protein